MHERIAAAERGENPTVMMRMSTSWAVIGDTQHLPGYSLLLYAGTANHLSDLNRAERADFLMDMSILGEAVANACQRLDSGFRRINYEILGNSFEHLHAHVHPRYEWEPAEHRHSPVWTYPDRKSPRYALSTRHDPLREAITAELQQLLHLTSVGNPSDSPA